MQYQASIDATLPRGETCRHSVAVLISGGEHLGVLAAVRALRQAGHQPWVAVHNHGGYAARSHAVTGVVHVPNPAKDENGFVSALARAAALIPARIVLPGAEADLFAISRHSGRFPGGALLGVGPPAAVDRATDKALLVEVARAVGLAVPRTWHVSLAGLPAEPPFPFPVVVKPLRSELRNADGSLCHYVPRRVDSAGEMRDAVAALPGARGLVQPYLRGHLVSLAGVCWDGEIVCAVQSRANRIWPVHCGSMTYAVTVPPDHGLTARIGGLLRAIEWNGLFQLDLIEHDGQCLLIDLNPRVYTSLAITTAAGINLMAAWVDLLQGYPPPRERAYRIGVPYRHDEDDIRALFAMLIRGRPRAACEGLLPRRGTAHAVFSLRDPLPLVTTLSKLGRLAKR